MQYIPSVAQALPGPGKTVYAYFTYGTIRLYDVTPLVEKGGVFAPLSNDDVFRDALTVMNDTVAWDIAGTRNATTCIDIDPETIYEDGDIVDDPLRDIA